MLWITRKPMMTLATSLAAAFRILKPKWQLGGYDTFANAAYFIGTYHTQRCCLWAAWFHLKKLERGAGAEVDGGPPPDGIRDTVEVSGPQDQRAHFKTSTEVSEHLRALRKRGLSRSS